MKLRCIAVDDDILSSTILEEFLNQIPYVEICGIFSNALPVYEFLQKETVDILFLDIEMPTLSGIELLKSLKNPPTVIVISANPKYALEGYALNVFDYILKPIVFERVLKPIHKIYESKSKQVSPDILSKNNKFLFLKENRKMIKVELKNILYIESIKDYVKVVCKDKTVTTKQQISFFETTLNSKQFLRIHKSFIISTSHIDAYDAMSVEIGKVEIPIGRAYKEKVLQNLDKIV
jgi:DNA-binding LytR/AlgR family response regulator